MWGETDWGERDITYQKGHIFSNKTIQILQELYLVIQFCYNIEGNLVSSLTITVTILLLLLLKSCWNYYSFITGIHCSQKSHVPLHQASLLAVLDWLPGSFSPFARQWTELNKIQQWSFIKRHTLIFGIFLPSAKDFLLLMYAG